MLPATVLITKEGDSLLWDSPKNPGKPTAEKFSGGISTRIELITDSFYEEFIMLSVLAR